MAMQNGVVRVAAVGDVHCTKNSQGLLQPIFAAVAESADVLALCGDLCDYGTVEDVTPDTILVRWRTHTVTRTTAGLTIHHSHVYERSVRVVRP